MRKMLAILCFAVVALAGFGAVLVNTGNAGNKTVHDADHVTICHATGSSSNPYVQISPSASGVFNGHLGKSHQDGRDIIPPFEYKGKTYSQNWDATGQAIWKNGCVKPSTTTTTSTTPTTTTTPTKTTPTTTVVTTVQSPPSTTTQVTTVTVPTQTVTTSKTVTVKSKPRVIVKKKVVVHKVVKKVYLPTPPKNTTEKPNGFPWTK